LKNRNKLILNILIVALCLCTIVVGVWSAKNASIGISGSVGFTAHNCEVDVYATIVGDATDDTCFIQNTLEKDVLKSSNTIYTKTSPLSIGGGTTSQSQKSVALDKIYFVENENLTNPKPVKLRVYVKNKSSFMVTANIAVNSNFVGDKDVQITALSTEFDLESSNSSEWSGSHACCFELTITLKSNVNNFSLSSANVFTINFAQTSVASKVRFDEALNMYCLKMGKYEGLDVVWVPIAYSETGNEGEFYKYDYTTGHVYASDNTTILKTEAPQKDKHYYFMSYYVLPTGAYSSNISYFQKSASNYGHLLKNVNEQDLTVDMIFSARQYSSDGSYYYWSPTYYSLFAYNYGLSNIRWYLKNQIATTNTQFDQAQTRYTGLNRRGEAYFQTFIVNSSFGESNKFIDDFNLLYLNEIVETRTLQTLSEESHSTDIRFENLSEYFIEWTNDSWHNYEHSLTPEEVSVYGQTQDKFWILSATEAENFLEDKTATFLSSNVKNTWWTRSVQSEKPTFYNLAGTLETYEYLVDCNAGIRPCFQIAL